MDYRKSKYQKLLENLLDEEITAVQFEVAFLEAFKNEPEGMPRPLFDVLNNLFYDVDRFCADDELREQGDLNETGLRRACEKTLLDIAGL